MEVARGSLFVYRQSALMLKCSDMEPLLGKLRARLDPSAADGVPAHLNLLYPFTSRLSVEQDDQLIQVLHDFGRFQLDFSTTAWFGEDSVYLSPDSPTVLNNLVTRIREVFPDYPAFGAVPERAVPHVTIGKRASQQELQVAERRVLDQLPVSQNCTTVELWSGPPPGTGRWRRHRPYQLGS